MGGDSESFPKMSHLIWNMKDEKKFARLKLKWEDSIYKECKGPGTVKHRYSR